MFTTGPVIMSCIMFGLYLRNLIELYKGGEVLRIRVAYHSGQVVTLATEFAKMSEAALELYSDNVPRWPLSISESVGIRGSTMEKLMIVVSVYLGYSVSLLSDVYDLQTGPFSLLIIVTALFEVNFNGAIVYEDKDESQSATSATSNKKKDGNTKKNKARDYQKWYKRIHYCGVIAYVGATLNLCHEVFGDTPEAFWFIIAISIICGAVFYFAKYFYVETIKNDREEKKAGKMWSTEMKRSFVAILAEALLLLVPSCAAFAGARYNELQFGHIKI